MPTLEEQLGAVQRGLFVGQEIASGADRYRIETAARRVRSLASGRFASLRDVLDADVQKRLLEREEVLRGLASQLTVLLAQNLKDLTGRHYATLRQLAAMGHPYARRHFRDALGRYNPRSRAGRAGLPSPPGAVNDQSGFLSSGFEVSVVQAPGGMFSVLATNPALYAAALADGTGTMIARPYDRLAAERAQAQMNGAVRAATARLEALGEPVRDLKAPEVDFVLAGNKRSYTAK